MKFATSKLKRERERKRYVEKQRSSRAFNILCDPSKLGRIMQEMANGPTQDTLIGMEMPTEDYYAAAVQYLDNYMWEIAGHLPASDAKLGGMFEGAPRNTSNPSRSGALPKHKERNSRDTS